MPIFRASCLLGCVKLISTAIIFVIALQFNSLAFADFLSDTDPHPTPDIPRPEYLMPIIDPVFGSTVVRITDSGQPIYNPTGDPSLVGRIWGYETGHGYSSRVAWNADQSILMIGKGVDGQVFLDGATYEPLFRRSVPGRKRWHPVDPDVMLFVDKGDQCVGGYDVWSDSTLWQRCFVGYESLKWSDPGKGKPSVDGNIIPLLAQRSGDGHWVAFLYYIDSDTVSGEIDMMPFVEVGDDPDFTMSPLGDTIVINGCIIGHSGRCKAQVAIDVETQQELWRVLTYHDPGHADEIIDDAGEQWRVGRSKEGTLGTIKRNFRTGEAVSLTPYSASHTSTRAILAPPHAILSFHTPSGPFQNEIVGVCLDGTCLERYAHTHRFDDDRYLAESQASVSPYGDQIVFRSNWDTKDGPVDAYVIDISGGSSSDPGPTVGMAPTVAITASVGNSSIHDGDSITFTGTASDPEDGDITASLAWRSDLDGAIGNGGSFSSTLSVGTHAITASATDSDGLTGSAQITVAVTAANTAPVASFTAMPSSGAAPLTVAFDATGSNDGDGTITAYAWDFGDGASGTGATVSHIYASGGDYTVTLTVTDDGGATNSTSQGVTVSEPASTGMHVGDINGSTENNKNQWRARASFAIHDLNHGAIPDALVSYSWVSREATGSGTCTTDGTGQCLSNWTPYLKRRSQSVTFTVENVTSSLPYLAANNHDPGNDSDGTTITIGKP